jgi:serine/threonine protein kinase
MQRYQMIEALGSGAFGDVFKAKDLHTDQIVALKRIRNVDLADEGISATTLREIGLLRMLNHPNIAKLHDVVHAVGDPLYLVLEFAKHDLSKYMALHGPLSQDIVKVNRRAAVFTLALQSPATRSAGLAIYNHQPFTLPCVCPPRRSPSHASC